MKRFMLFLILFSVTISTCYSLSTKAVNKLAEDFMKKNQVEGMSIAVIDKDETFIFNYGYANKENKILTTSNTIYTIASFTKTFTAMLAAVASVEGELNLDETIVKYFPDLKDNVSLNKITSSKLLGHVSSLPFDFYPRPNSYPTLLANLKTFIPTQEPGTLYNYSNAGIGTMGYVLQNVYGKEYQKILDEKILKPLGMNATYLIVPANQEKLIANGHDQNNMIVPYNKEIETWFAAASLKSTITDMAKYLQAHIKNNSSKNRNIENALKVVHQNKYCFADGLSCEQLAWQAHDISLLNGSTGDTYFLKFSDNGFPLFDSKKIIKINTLNKKKIFIDKTGSGYGMSSYMAYVPEQTGVVILINKSIGDERIRLGRDILKKMVSSRVD